jgi:hypothetical protein
MFFLSSLPTESLSRSSNPYKIRLGFFHEHILEYPKIMSIHENFLSRITILVYLMMNVREEYLISILTKPEIK